MAAGAEAVNAALIPVDPNVIGIAPGVEVDVRILGALMTHVYRIDQAVGAIPRADGSVAPIVPPKLKGFLQPHDIYRDDGGALVVAWRNPNRDRVMTAVHAGPLAGQILLTLARSESQFGTPEKSQRTLAEAGALLQPSAQQKLGEVTPRDAARILDFALKQLLPFAMELDAYGALVRTPYQQYLANAERYVAILTSGEQRGTRQELQHEISVVLDTVLHTARARAASRARAEKQDARQKTKDRLEAQLRDRPDDFLRREDVAAGIAHTVTELLGSRLSTPMMNSLIQQFMGGRNMDLSKAVKYIEIASDFIVDALIRTLPPEVQNRYRGLDNAASGGSGAATLGNMAISASSMVPKRLRARVAERYGQPGFLGERGKAIYAALRENLGPALQALVALLPTNNESVRDLYRGAGYAIGAVVVAEVSE